MSLLWSGGIYVSVPKLSLNVDHSYQRKPVNDAKVRSIADNWLLPALGTLVVARRPAQTLWVLDGQTRRLASLLLPHVERLPCLVFDMDDVALEARIYRMLNSDRTQVGAFDKFKAMVIGRDPVAVEARNMVEEHGYRVEEGGYQKTVACVESLMFAVRQDPVNADYIFGLCADIYRGEAVSGVVYKALFILERHLERHDRTLAEASNNRGLHRAGPNGLVAAVADAKRYYRKGGAQVAAQGIRDMLNYRRRQGTALPMVLRGDPAPAQDDEET